MIRPFDLAAAQRGEPIEYKYGSYWINAHFVGCLSNGCLAVELMDQKYPEAPALRCLSLDDPGIRMAPKKVTVRYRVGLFMNDSGRPYTLTAEDEDDEDHFSHKTFFVAWDGDWRVAEVPQGGE